MLLSILWTQLFAPALGQLAGPGHFFFQWPTQTSQCQMVSLTWADAVPPFSAWVIPLGQQPFIYDIPDSAYFNGYGEYDIQLQLNQGTNYVMLMSDGRGMGSGGTSNTQIVASSPNTACLNSAASNQTAKQFSFSVAGTARQCETGFELTWDGTPENQPYNFTVVPLQQGYYPFDVDIREASGWTRDWAVNMTEGTKFTVVMNNKNGYGTGGAAGIYEIANGTGGSDSCIQQTLQPTAIWPVGVATNTLPVATQSARPGDPQYDGDGGLGGGAIAGIVIGVLAALALLGFLLFWLRRRKRRRQEEEFRGKEPNNLDLADGVSERGGGYDDPIPADLENVSPYLTQDHSHGLGGRGDSMGLTPTATPHRSDSGNRSENSTSGFAGLGAGAAGAAGAAVAHGHDQPGGSAANRDSWAYSHDDPMGYAMEDGENRSGPGIAPPLPPKGFGFRPSSSQPSTLTSRPDSGYTVNSSQALGGGGSGKRDSGQTLQSRSGYGAGFAPANNTGNGNGNGNGNAHPPLPPGAGVGHVSNPNSHGRGGMRIVNHDHPDELPAVEPQHAGVGAGIGPGHGHGRRTARISEDFNRRMEFRRHADAGRVDYVDLPPLYTDVPRDGGDAAVMRGPAALAEAGRGASGSSAGSQAHGGGYGTVGNGAGIGEGPGSGSPASPHTPLLADVDPLSAAGDDIGRRPSPLGRYQGP